MEVVISKPKLIISILSNLIAFLIPVILWYPSGSFENSISSYHLTDAKWYLFISLIVISFGYFIGKREYRISGILLILIAIINIEYELIHNIIAGLFFAYTAVLMFMDKRFWYLSLPMFVSSLTIPFMVLYPFEIISLLCIITFNVLYILRYIRILNIR
jgi:hypothetical protein